MNLQDISNLVSLMVYQPEGQSASSPYNIYPSVVLPAAGGAMIYDLTGICQRDALMRRLTSTGKNNPTGAGRDVIFCQHEATLGQNNELSQQRSASRMYTCTKHLAR
jgi:hypothetical protein